MPNYEFECTSCGAIMELFIKMSDPNPTKCSECGGGPVNKLLSAPNFHLKGGGWYADGYDGKSNKKPKSSEAEKPEQKPAQKTDTTSDT